MLDEGRYTDRYFTRNLTLYDKCPIAEPGTNLDHTPKYQLLYPKKTTLQRRMHCNDVYFLNFIHELLSIDPAERPTSAEALNHPWLTEVVYEGSPFS